MRSRKRSVRKSPPPPDDEPTYFVDASIGRAVVQRLRDAGMKAIGHDEVFAQGTKDPVWLARAGKERWVVLTKDQAIRYSPLELEALRRAGIGQFVLTSGNLTAEQMAAAFLAARPAMLATRRRTPSPFVARVSRDGKISAVRRLS